ncbi:hypothetical protein FKM82_016230 [Ascaphus truei]
MYPLVLFRSNSSNRVRAHGTIKHPCLYMNHILSLWVIHGLQVPRTDGMRSVQIHPWKPFGTHALLFLVADDHTAVMSESAANTQICAPPNASIAHMVL